MRSREEVTVTCLPIVLYRKRERGRREREEIEKRE
jgi:hypothetical protein